jgi:acyl-CoA synthetase (AMP-forming)/AMP-acid ligase II
MTATLESLLERNTNITSLLRSARGNFGDREAVVCGDTRLTYEQLGNRVDRLAGGLAGLGVRSGMRIAVLAKNCHRYLEAYLAAAHLGAVLVPVNYRLSSRELGEILADSGPHVLLVSPAFKSVWDVNRERLTGVRHLVLLDERGDGDSLAYEQLLRTGASSVPTVERDPDDMLYLFYTSGTTGQAKGVMLSKRNVVFGVSAIHYVMHLTTRDRVLRTSNPFHIGGLSIWAVVSAGACQLVLPEFDPTRCLQVLQDERVTVAGMVVPTMLNAMVAVPDADSYDLSAMRLLTYGASPISEALLRKTGYTFGCHMLQYYGMTEVGVATVLSPEDHVPAAPDQVSRIQSAGRAVLGVDVRTVDDQDHDVAGGEVGEVIVRGPNVMLGYWNQPEMTAEALRNGWMHTGDLATMDGDGYLYIVDRKKDMIISGGENVYSSEVESVLCQHPAVSEAAVVGAPDPTWGETVKAAVVLKPEQTASAETLQDFCRERIAGYKVPRSVEFLESLPKTATGKISKKDLRAGLNRPGTCGIPTDSGVT